MSNRILCKSNSAQRPFGCVQTTPGRKYRTNIHNRRTRERNDSTSVNRHEKQANCFRGIRNVIMPFAWKKNGSTTLIPHQFHSQNCWTHTHTHTHITYEERSQVTSLETSAKNRAACLSTRNPDSQHWHRKNVPKIFTGNHHSWRGCVFGDDVFMEWPPHSQTAHAKLALLCCRLFIPPVS